MIQLGGGFDFYPTQLVVVNFELKILVNLLGLVLYLNLMSEEVLMPLEEQKYLLHECFEANLRFFSVGLLALSRIHRSQ